MTFVDRVRSFSGQSFVWQRGRLKDRFGPAYGQFVVATGMTVLLPVFFLMLSPREFWVEGLSAFLISLAIFVGFAGFALFVSFQTLGGFRQEIEVGNAIFAKVKTDLAKLDGDEDSLRPDDIQPSHYIPYGQEKTACAKLVEKHFNTARALRSDDGIAAQVVANDLNYGRTSLRALAAFALRIGILLTFFGLLLGLAPIGAALESGGLEEIPIGKLLSGLTISFTSSIAGLAAALVIGMMSQATDHSFNQLRVLVDDLALGLRQVYSRVRFGGDLSKTVDHLTEEMRSHAREMENHGVQVERSVNIAADAFRSHATESAAIMEKIGRSTEDVAALERQHREQIDSLRETSRELASFEGKLTSHLDALMDGSVKSLQDHSETLSKSVATEFSILRERLGTAQREDNETLRDVLKDLVEANATVTGALEGFTAKADAREGDLSGAMNSLRKSIEELMATRQKPRSNLALYLMLLLALAGVGYLVAMQNLDFVRAFLP